MNISNHQLDSEPIVRTRGLVKEYRMGDTVVRALDGVTLDIAKGNYVSIMGPSGSGKSTLFNMIGGLDKPTAGSVYVNQIDIAQLSPSELAYLRCNTIGYIFQTFNLIQVRTAIENVALPMLFAGMPADEADERAARLLDLVGLENRYHHRPSELSGGQQQRVAIARALANEPAILLADEPTGNLDLKTGQEIIYLLRRLNQEQGVTIISATHDLKMVDVSDIIIHVRDGKVSKIEAREEVRLQVGGLEEESS